ncbi:MAG TPA: helix-turn-helix domain-containing protein [Pyrinomonadaceae bacterium]|nr:helix-turn-helix domain-containing protein [Pyrinomonadaceae bacterium]
MSALDWGTEDHLRHQAVNFLRDEAFECRLSSLRDVALELLNAVESLRTATHDRNEHQLKLNEEVRRFETDLINAALIRTRGNQSQAARLLGVKHTTLNAKIKRYGISIDGHRPDGEVSDQEIAA